MRSSEMAHSFRGGGKAAVGAGTLPVGFQGRSALAAGGCRREAKELHKQNRDFAA